MSDELYTPRIEISTVVQFRGRSFTVTCEGYTVEQFADILDRKFGPPSTTTAPAPSGAAPSCPVHHKPMKEMTRPDRAGHTHWCTAKTDAGFCAERG